MTESEFNKLAEQTLQEIENAVEASGADIEVESSGGILTLEFEDGSQIVVNQHGAMQQIWVAAKAGGHHYGWTDGQWRNTRDGGELFESLGRFISAQAGEKIVLTST